ncbi:tyrosyl-DNA phosphodiesterase 2-like [Plakobranchus ocellatus]|uniref:Tyrosyl-DNA phosphodiesterase 2-like n=1 Tax=Plakobranchus ocellatus TaxID=259542 RepID=A0AAV4AER0_9GAST|nr:tyrosyl-DNA phosphodiesterase 2-like [Plakobranchus ocellatus]
MAASNKIHTVSDSDEGKSDEDDANLPSRDECESRCQMFAEITGTDSALAMFYLQDREWDLQRAVSDYFADHDKDGTASSGETKKHEAGKNQSKTSGCASSTATSSNLSDPNSLTLGPSVLQPEQEGLVRILSWNIDGLDPGNLQSRTEGACAVLLQEHPEVIFLQEVVKRSLDIIRARMEGKYTVLTGDEDTINRLGAYFTAMLLRKDSVTLERVRVMDYPGSSMSRDLMEVQAQVKGIPMVLLTSHLESTKDYAAERRRQLKTAFDQMLEAPPVRTVVFGGDLNLRDKELSGLSAKPPGVYDLWECTGKREEAKFTWDLMINDNKQMANKFQPRCRFDRLYIRHGKRQSPSQVSSPEVKGNSKPISSYFSKDGNTSHSIGSNDSKQSSETGDGSLGSNSQKRKREESEYVTRGAEPSLKPVYFELVGIQRLASCRRFPSDHWGILAHLHIEKALGEKSSGC